MTTGNGSKKANKQELAIAALLAAPTYADAAKAIGVSEQTIWRWMQDDKFHDAFIDAKRQALGQAITQLQTSVGEAVKTLNELMKEKRYPHVRLNAARTIIEMAFKGYELDEVESRLAELEKAAGLGR